MAVVEEQAELLERENQANNIDNTETTDLNVQDSVEYTYSPGHEFYPNLITVAIIFIVLPIISLLMMKNVEAITPSKAICGILVISHFFYFFHLFPIIYHSNLYRIQPRYSNVKGWYGIRMMTKFERYPKHAVESISELSSLKGTRTHLLLLTIGEMTAVLYIGNLFWTMDIWSQTTNSTLAALLCMGPGLGLLILGAFELDPNYLPNQMVHYFGSTICFCGNLGLGFETQWGIWFWSLTIIQIVAAAIFIYTFKTAQVPSDDAIYVNKISKICIVSEGTVLLAGALALDVYLIYTHDK
eukprot:549290_1